MKHCIALAALACLCATGCANSGLLGGRGCCAPCHVATSRSAPRPTIMRNACMPCCAHQCDDVCCDASCGGCDSGACDDCCRGMVDGVAGGFCGRRGGRAGGCACGGAGCAMCAAGGLCPNSGGYPEYPAFSGGPPTGQVAYPYYTVRGPRDYLACKPGSIGPY